MTSRTPRKTSQDLQNDLEQASPRHTFTVLGSSETSGRTLTSGNAFLLLLDWFCHFWDPGYGRFLGGPGWSRAPATMMHGWTTSPVHLEHATSAHFGTSKEKGYPPYEISDWMEQNGLPKGPRNRLLCQRMRSRTARMTLIMR